jgi:hypothetical protein
VEGDAAMIGTPYVTPKYTIGQAVWIVTFDPVERKETCPDCGGTKSLRAILFDGTEHVIDCAGCSRGFNGSYGYFTVFDRLPHPKFTVITGIHSTGAGIEYETHAHHRMPEAKVFLAQTEAEECAAIDALAHNEQERARFQKKEKDTRTWAWNVHYHRDRIRRAEKDIAYHAGKLAVARAKAKEPEPEDAMP